MIYVQAFDLNRGVHFQFLDTKEDLEKVKQKILDSDLKVRIIEKKKYKYSDGNTYNLVIVSNREYKTKTSDGKIIARCLKPVSGWIKANTGKENAND